MPNYRNHHTFLKKNCPHFKRKMQRYSLVNSPALRAYSKRHVIERHIYLTGFLFPVYIFSEINTVLFDGTEDKIPNRDSENSEYKKMYCKSILCAQLVHEEFTLRKRKCEG